MLKNNHKKKTLKSLNHIFDIITPKLYHKSFSLISPSKIIITSIENISDKITLNINNDIFLNGCFRTTDRKIFATSCYNKKINLFDLNKGNLIKTLRGHNGPIHSISFSDNGINFLTGGDDGVVKIWDITVQDCLSFLKFKKSFIRCIACWPNNNQIFACSSYDGFIRINDLRANNLSVANFNHGCPVEKCKFTPDGKNLISIGGNIVNIWDFLEKKVICSYQEEKPVINIDINYNTILYSTLNGIIKILDFSKRYLESFYISRKNITSFASLSGGTLIGFSDGTIIFKKLNKKNKTLSDRFVNLKRLTQKKQNYYSKIFFIPKKKNVNSKNCFLEKFTITRKKNARIQINKISKKKSFDFLFRNCLSDDIYQILLEKKKENHILSYLYEIIINKNFCWKFSGKNIQNFFFLLNLVLIDTKLISIPKTLWILVKFYHIAFSIVDFFKLYSNIINFLEILSVFLKKTLDLYVLKCILESMNFLL